jgi:hypothetical protein
MLKRTTAERLYNQGDLAIDGTNSAHGEIVYTPVVDATKHPQWPAWHAWYTKHYTAHVPMFRGEPANLDTLLSWETWKASHEAAKPKWRKFADEKPPHSTEIFWRVETKDPLYLSEGVAEGWLVGVGWYNDEDATEWAGEWLPVSELQ